VRACLTVIDHNRNADRKPRKDRDGADKVTSVSTRDGLDSKKRVIMEAKDTSWRQEILAEVLQVRKFEHNFLPYRNLVLDIRIRILLSYR
jgi:hypothetical protein